MPETVTGKATVKTFKPVVTNKQDATTSIGVEVVLTFASAEEVGLDNLKRLMGCGVLVAIEAQQLTFGLPPAGDDAGDGDADEPPLGVG